MAAKGSVNTIIKEQLVPLFETIFSHRTQAFSSGRTIVFYHPWDIVEDVVSSVKSKFPILASFYTTDTKPELVKSIQAVNSMIKNPDEKGGKWRLFIIMSLM